ncbi:hypothetical protein MKW94_013525 [Papaver nudicaule]|uniref:Protein BIG GRAIN 1-like A n=1 Tax=Papaver nudicaule TaxID=74823 RepID=A0AA42AZH0_PAPNU|nr:hypothetical protein [Papaver nudicaule]
MDQLKWEKSLRESKYRHDQRKNPSFSSSLLDEIYRSIDEGDDNGGGGGGGGGFVKQGVEEVIYREKTMKKKQTNREELIENWMEKRIMSTTEKVVVRRNSLSLPDSQRNYGYSSSNGTRVFNSSSSDSCYGSSGFSSSETDQSSIYSSSRSMKPASIKPIRTSFSSEDTKKNVCLNNPQPKPTKKSRALKIYGDLKKVKQPISPGSKIASFINSLFTKENSKKPKLSSSVNGDDYNRHEDSRIYKSGYGTNSTCSSVSSYSRSCLSKNTSNSSNRIKRSVRFYPVSVIVDEDCRPCGHKCLYESDEPGLMAKVRRNDNKSSSMDEDLKIQIMEKNRRIEEKARDLLKVYQNKKIDYEMKDYLDDEDDDDAASDASSDLFELSSINGGGSIDQRYREELPVYETTHFLTNRAIANGLIV